MKTFKQVTYNVLDYHEMDELIRQNFRTLKDYEFVACEECSNDSYHAYHVVQRELSTWDWPYINDGVAEYLAGDLLDHLAWLGAIPAGDYLIRVSW